MLKLQEKRARQVARKARERDSAQALSKLGELVDGKYRIVSQPPFIVPLREVRTIYPAFPENVESVIEQQLAAYARTVRPDIRRLLERFELVDVARKVVGVGSVGTRAFIGLLEGRDETTRCSCSSRRRRGPCSRATCRRAATASRASGSCRVSV